MSDRCSWPRCRNLGDAVTYYGKSLCDSCFHHMDEMSSNDFKRKLKIKPEYPDYIEPEGSVADALSRKLSK